MICPTCHRETRFKDNPNRPFCSERCKLIDLGKWASGTYRVQGERVSSDYMEGEDAASAGPTEDDSSDRAP